MKKHFFTEEFLYGGNRDLTHKQRHEVELNPIKAERMIFHWLNLHLTEEPLSCSQSIFRKGIYQHQLFIHAKEVAKKE